MMNTGPGRSIHVLTLTPFYPSCDDDASGRFVSEPLAWLGKMGLRNTVFAVQPLDCGKSHATDSAVSADWLRHFALPGAFGIPVAGVFVFARIVGRVRALHGLEPIDLIQAHASFPYGHAAMLIIQQIGSTYVASVTDSDAQPMESVSSVST